MQMEPEDGEHRGRELDGGRQDRQSVEQAPEPWRQCEERQHDPVAKRDAAKRPDPQITTDDVVKIELLLIVLGEELFGGSMSERALRPRDFFHRDQEAKDREPRDEPRDHLLAAALSHRRDREDDTGDPKPRRSERFSRETS